MITLKRFHAILADAGVAISHSFLKVLARRGVFPVVALGEGREKRYYIASVTDARAAIETFLAERRD